MSVEYKDFSDQPVHKNLNNIQNLLKNININKLNDPELFESVEQMKHGITFIQIRFKTLNPILISNVTLTHINDISNKTLLELNNYTENFNIAHLTNARNHFDNLLHYIGILIYPTNITELEGFKESISSFRMSVGQYIRYLKEECDEAHEKTINLNKTLDSLKADLDSQKERVETHINEFQKQFSNNENQRLIQFTESEKNKLTSFNSFLEKSKNENDQLTDNLKNTSEQYINKFKNSYDNTKNKLAEDIKLLKEEAEDKIESFENTFIALKNDHTEQLNSLITKNELELNNYKEQAEKIVGVISNTGMASVYCTPLVDSSF